MPTKHILSVILFILSTSGLMSQITSQSESFFISGIVLDSTSKSPIPGATIISKSYNNATVSDVDGKFTINSKVSDSLIIQNIGYADKEIEVMDSNKSLLIYLSPHNDQLKDVTVNTGYQTLPKERATGSFEVINNQKLNLQVSPDIISRLKGISTINFDDGDNRPEMTIRGLSSIYGDKTPLIVINNFPYEGDINNINPNDIENVTILKDAAAASIWGTRASNGVIVITTKSAEFDHNLNVSFVSNLKITEKPSLSYTRQMSSSDFIDVEQFLFNHGYKFSDTAFVMRPAFTPVYEILFKERSGNLSHIEAQEKINKLRKKNVFDDFEKYIYQKGVLQQYALNIDGGSVKNAFHIAASFDKQIDELNSDYNRVTFHLEDRIRPIKGFQLKTSLIYNQSNKKSGKPSYESLRYKLYPYAQMASKEGSSLAINYSYRRPYIDTLGGGRLLDWKYYPLEDYKHDITTTKTQNILGNIDLLMEPVRHLKLKVQYQYERQQELSNNLNDEQSFFTRDLINMFTQLDPNLDKITYSVPRGSILDKSFASIESHSLRGQIDYHEVFNKSELALLVGSEIRNIRSEGNSYRLFGYNDDILTFGNVDFMNAHPTTIPGMNLFIPDNKSLSERTNRFISVFANGAYTFKNRYIFSASMRRDASNLFGVSTNDKWSPLWSAGASWIINNESFWNLSFLNYLKLRFTYGFSGNVDQNRSAVTTLKYFGNSIYTNFPYSSIDQLANPDLRWEKTGVFNVGLDFSTRNHSLYGSIEYYRKNGVDLFGTTPIDWTATGRNSLLMNIANMKGSGWDINLSSYLINRAVKWNISLNASISKTEVSQYNVGNAASSEYINNGSTINPIVGHPIYGIVAYKWGGLDPKTGDPLGFLNGKKSKEYREIFNQDYTHLNFIGSATPTEYGSLLQTISYKNFSLSANVMFKFGYYYRKPSIDYNSLLSSYYGDIDYKYRWQKPGDENITNVPSLVYPNDSHRNSFYLRSEAIVEKADNIRVQFIALNYSLSENKLAYLPVKTLSFSINVNNLGIIWRAGDKNIDPDYPNSISPLKSLSFGLKANF